jgi:hypothetical protein
MQTPGAHKHRGIGHGHRYTMPGDGTDPADPYHAQYRDEEDNPDQHPAEYLSTQQCACFFIYCLTMLNLVGPYPCIQGLSPFANDPYGYCWEHLDEWGRLGKFKWTYRTQLLPKNYPFLLHQVFIPLNIPQFNFDPRIHPLQARGSNPNLHSLAVAFLNKVRTAGMTMLCCIRHINHVKAHFHLVLPLDYDPDWHFGLSWSHLLQQGMTPAPAWKATHIV